MAQNTPDSEFGFANLKGGLQPIPSFVGVNLAAICFCKFKVSDQISRKIG